MWVTTGKGEKACETAQRTDTVTHRHQKGETDECFAQGGLIKKVMRI